MMSDFLAYFLTYLPTPVRFFPNVNFQFYYMVSDFGKSTYLPKNRTSFMDVPLCYNSCLVTYVSRLIYIMNLKKNLKCKYFLWNSCSISVTFFCFNIRLKLQCWPIEMRYLLKRKDVSFIFTTFSKSFWNKWYVIWKPLYKAFRISKDIGRGIILRVATPP